MTDNPTPQSDEDPFEHVGWWCWRGDNHGHLATTACRSDNVPIHVPADWADEMRAVIQRIEDGDDEQPPAVPASSPLPDQTLRDRIADVLAKADGWTWTPDFDRTLSPVWQGYLKRADAVLAVLPPADRAAVLREAADTIEAEQDRLETEERARFDWVDRDTALQGEAVRARAAQLRRMASEAQQQPDTETPAYDRTAWEAYRRDAGCACTSPDPSTCAVNHRSGPWLCVCHRLSAELTEEERARLLPKNPAAASMQPAAADIGEEPPS